MRAWLVSVGEHDATHPSPLDTPDIDARDRTGSRTAGRRSRAMCPNTVRWCRPISLPISRLGNPCADNSAIRHFSNSDNRSDTTHLPIDQTRSKVPMR